MSTITLSARLKDSQLKQASKQLESIVKGLKVEIKIAEITRRGWAQISVSGEDESVALKYIADTIGQSQTSLENVQKFSTAKGFVTGLSRSKSEIYVDIGVSLPATIDAVIPLRCLQAQLCDGRKIALEKIAEVFGFCENLPMSIRVVNVDRERRFVEAELSERQQRQYGGWTRSLLDRLLVVGASLAEIELALRRLELDRDVINVEPLGLFEHAIVCKLGTDAAGLIPKVGRHLRRAAFSIFSPRRIRRFFEEKSTAAIP